MIGRFTAFRSIRYGGVLSLLLVSWPHVRGNVLFSWIRWFVVMNSGTICECMDVRTVGMI